MLLRLQAPLIHSIDQPHALAAPLDLHGQAPSTPPAADLHRPFLQAAHHHMQQHLAFSAAGAAAVLSAAQNAMHLPRIRTRTFTPSRVRPISEVRGPEVWDRR